MRDLTLTAGTVSRVRRGESRIDDWARQAVVRQLSGLRGGRITLEDGSGSLDLGSGELRARVWIRHPDFYRRLLFGGSLGAAESFMEGDWDTDNLSATLRIFARDLAMSERMEGGWAWARGLGERARHFLHRNTPWGSARNIHAHYDLGNEFFRLFLDDTMNYSSGIFERSGASMTDASIAKMDRVCRKLDLGPGDHLLEIGTGWGGLAVHAASHYGCRVTTTTISREQYDLAQERVREAGLSSQVLVLLEDYRRLRGTYDKLVSIEMIEAVGHAYVETYFRQCAELLRPDGLMLVQAIVTPDYRYESSRRSADFVRRYIFPGSCLMSVGRMAGSIGRVTDFSTLDVEEIGPHYAETLRRWGARFVRNLDQIRALGFDERFIRMWKYYLAYCEAGFEERIVGDVQMLLARPMYRGAVRTRGYSS